jgi:Tol biopolymer transport system component
MPMRHPHARRRVSRAALAVLLLLLPAAAQAQFGYFPYYGKNKVKYDNFDWRIYQSPHFEVYYYPEFEQHLERLVSYMESAYQQVSADLKHEIAFSIPIILYKTSSEFQQTNLYPDFLPEGVLAFAEPVRDRMVIPIDEPPDRLQGLITHELTHIFEFDLIPRSLVQRSVPLWVDEGLADYMRGLWDPLDLMMIRDAAVADQIPRLSRSDVVAIYGNARLVYNIGHAAFEFMEARYGKEGIRQFIYTLRKNIIGGGMEDIYRQAFRTSPGEFDDAFDKWLKERFKVYRDKQRPSDYGRLLSPDSERTPYTQVLAFAPSPSGELVAAFTGNRADGEIDLVLLSTQDGAVLKNLTPGYASEYEYPDLNLSARTFGRSVSFAADGSAVAFFARTGKRRSLVLVSALNGKILRRVPIMLDQASAPALLPDGRRALFTALDEGISDVYLLDLDSGQATNLTRDAFADSDPQISPDGKLVVYSRRVSGHEKLYMFPLDDPSRKTPISFGVQDDVTPIFSPDGNLVYYTSNEDDDIFNLRSLDLRTGVVRQYTDVLGGNLMPALLPGQQQRLAFVSYFKGEYRLHSIEPGDPMKEVDQEVRTAEDEFIDFQPDLSHQVIPENKRRKKLFEKLYLEGRPPLNVAVTSSGDFFGGTQVVLSDVLGDQNFGFTFYSFADFRTYAGSYVNLASRLRWGAYFFDQTNWFYPNNYFQYNYYSREGALFTQRQTGGVAFGQYPLDKFNRIELGAGVVKYKEQYSDPAYQAYIEELYAQLGIEVQFLDGYTAPFSLRFVRETTRFREFGPLAGDTLMIGAEFSPGFSSFYSRQTVEADARKYLRFGSTSSLLAARFRGFYSTGEYPDIFWFGGNMDLRGYPYASFVGNQGFFANLELRLPVIDVMRTPIGLLGPVRGVAFVGVGGAKYKNQPYTLWTSEPGLSYVRNPVFGEPVDGFHLVDGRATYGFGFQMFFLGYPLHFDWTKFWDFKVSSPSWKFSFWIGYDF